MQISADALLQLQDHVGTLQARFCTLLGIRGSNCYGPTFHQLMSWPMQEDGLHAALSNSLLGLKSAAQVLANLPIEAARSEAVSLDHSKLREQVQLWVQCACCLLSQIWELSSTASNILQVKQAASTGDRYWALAAVSSGELLQD